MSSKSIYSPLFDISHNLHYLQRYIKFISSYKLNKKVKHKTEYHHILPRSLFPEFSDLEINSWNGVHLTKQQHFIAHWILWKSYPENQSMKHAFWSMCIWIDESQKRYSKINGKTYQLLKEDISQIMSSRLSTNNPWTSINAKTKIIEEYGGLGFSSPQIFKKYKDTMLTKYNVDNYFKDPNFIKKNAKLSSDRWKDPIYKKNTSLAIKAAKQGIKQLRCSCILDRKSVV